MLLASHLVGQIRHTLDGASSAVGGEMAVLNQAGRHLFSMYPWEHTSRAATLLSLVANQEYVALPADFGALEALNATNSLDRSVRMVTIGEMLALRTSSLRTGDWSYSAAVQWWRNSTTGAVEPRLELWPTPTAAATDALTLVYSARWVEVSNDNDAVRIPAFMEGLLIQLARAFARGLDEEEEVSLSRRLAEIQAGPIMAAAMRFDAGAQINLGQMHGSEVRFRGIDTEHGYDSFPVSAPA